MLQKSTETENFSKLNNLTAVEESDSNNNNYTLSNNNILSNIQLNRISISNDECNGNKQIFSKGRAFEMKKLLIQKQSLYSQQNSDIKSSKDESIKKNLCIRRLPEISLKQAHDQIKYAIQELQEDNFEINSREQVANSNSSALYNINNSNTKELKINREDLSIPSIKNNKSHNLNGNLYSQGFGNQDYGMENFTRNRQLNQNQYRQKQTNYSQKEDHFQMTQYKKFLIEKKNQLATELERTSQKIQEECQKLAAREEMLIKLKEEKPMFDRLLIAPKQKKCDFNSNQKNSNLNHIKPLVSGDIVNQEVQRPKCQERSTTINFTSKFPLMKTSKNENNPYNGTTKYKLEKYDIGVTIGMGSYATVKLATNRENNEKYAIKIYEKFKLFDPQKKKNLMREIQILQKLYHPNIVQYIETIEDHKSINLVMEFVSQNSLHKYLKTKPGRKLDEEETKKMFKQVISALSYLHQRNIVHRDIKLENILLDEKNNIKLIDFGFSIYIPSDKKLSIFCGTPQYMSPEIVAKKEYYGAPADVWAAGVLLYIMLVGQFPFKAADEKKLYQKIQKGEFAIPNSVSSGAEHLLRKLLNPNYQERVTADQALKDTWISPINISEQLIQLKLQCQNQNQSQSQIAN